MLIGGITNYVWYILEIHLLFISLETILLFI